jgi:hypothetical protein
VTDILGLSCKTYFNAVCKKDTLITIYLKNGVFWKTPFLIVTAVKTSNLTQSSICEQAIFETPYVVVSRQLRTGFNDVNYDRYFNAKFGLSLEALTTFCNLFDLTVKGTIKLNALICVATW